MQDIRKHKRVNEILLGPLERPALQWLSVHMPGWVTPDVCTVIGVLGAVVIAVSYGLSGLNKNFLWLASLGFVINWFGDSLDGTLARYRHIERPKYGFYIDHTIDAACQVIIFLGLGLTPYVSFNIACLALIAYMMLSVLVYVRTCVVGEFKISYGRLGPTEIRAIAIFLNTTMYFAGVRTFEFALGTANRITVSVYDVVTAAIALLLLGFFVTTAWKQALILAKLGE
ncbi:MAG: CDP-alcohol phosphatidyltransferase [Anaerolineae bacterium CG_4_9_14_0_8_um_filter_58_9]|nr:MAG: CDP-alcohol phosphatidyltransferase [Anaerolineae bacterium CG_4_9_14_0_8_um_filter_58_9]